GGRWVRLDIYGGECPAPRQRYEYGLLTLLTFWRWMLAPPFRPQLAVFSHGVPATLGPYIEAFDCPLRFNAAFNALLVSAEDLARKLPTFVPVLTEIHDRVAVREIQKLEKADTAYRAREAIARNLQDGTPLRSAIAAELKM